MNVFSSLRPYADRVGYGVCYWRTFVRQFHKRVLRRDLEITLPTGLRLNLPKDSHYASVIWLTQARTDEGCEQLFLRALRPEAELKVMGASKVIRVWRSYDEVDHRPREISADDQARWGSEVVFVGTWMPERGAFMAELVRRGLPLAIYGDFWPKAAEWTELKAAWRGSAVYGDDYAKAIQCSKIALGLLSKGNRDRPRNAPRKFLRWAVCFAPKGPTSTRSCSLKGKKRYSGGVRLSVSGSARKCWGTKSAGK